MGDTPRKYQDIPPSDARPGRFGPVAFLRMAGILGSALVVGIIQTPILVLRSRYWWPVVGAWHRLTSRLLGMEVEVTGHPFVNGPVLYVSNHISTLDIFALGGRLPNASFVAKHEVGQWPVARWFAGLHRTIYVNRSRRTETHSKADELADRVEQGDSLILFPEATTTWGQYVIPFKSALFSVAERAADREGDMLIQPVTLAYVGINGQPMVRARRAWLAWIGDMGVFSHLRQIFRIGKVRAIITLHEPVHLKDFGNRKAIAAHCEQAVREGLESVHRLEFVHGPQRGRE